MGRKQLHIVEGGTGLGKTGGGLDILRSGVGDALAQGDLFFIGKQAGLDDDLQELSAAGNLHRGDFGGNGIPFSFLGPADVDDHIHLIGAIFHRVGSHKALGFRGIVAVGEANDRADGKLISHIFLRLLHKGCRDAHGSRMVLHSVVADRPDLVPGSRLAQQGMVAFFEDFRNIHINNLLTLIYSDRGAG